MTIHRELVGSSSTWAQGEGEHRERIIMDAASESAASIALGLNYGDPHATIPFLWVSEFTFTSLGANHWEVEVLYKSKEDAEGELAPWLRNATASYSVSTNEFYTLVDLEGKPFVSSAGEVFDPPPSIKLAEAHLTVNKSYYNVNRHVFAQYVGCTNADVWNGHQPGTVLLENFTSQQDLWLGSYTFENMSFTYYIKANLPAPFGSHHVYLLDVGTYALDENGKKVYNQENEEATTTLKRLDGNGSFLANDSEEFHLRGPFKTFREISFSSAGLPYA